MGKPERVMIARGLAKAPLVLKNARVVNVFSGTIDFCDVAVAEGFVVGLGSYDGESEIDLQGRYLTPGFIDGHVHIESSMLTPPQFARCVLPWGTTAVVADPHEIGNIRGVEGVRYMIEAAASVPLDVFVMIPSCVPTTAFETAGATIGRNDVKTLLADPAVLGLGEVMDYPQVFPAARRSSRRSTPSADAPSTAMRPPSAARTSAPTSAPGSGPTTNAARRRNSPNA